MFNLFSLFRPLFETKKADFEVKSIKYDKETGMLSIIARHSTHRDSSWQQLTQLLTDYKHRALKSRSLIDGEKDEWLFEIQL